MASAAPAEKRRTSSVMVARVTRMICKSSSRTWRWGGVKSRMRHLDAPELKLVPIEYRSLGWRRIFRQVSQTQGDDRCPCEHLELSAVERRLDFFLAEK